MQINKLRSPGYQIAVAAGVIVTIGVGYVVFPPPADAISRILRIALLGGLGAILGIVMHDMFSRMRGQE